MKRIAPSFSSGVICLIVSVDGIIQVFGGAANADVGAAIAGVGDFNGDDIDDFVISAQYGIERENMAQPDGAAYLIYGDESHRIGVGDTVAFASDMPHTIKNIGETPLITTWVITPGRIFR